MKPYKTKYVCISVPPDCSESKPHKPQASKLKSCG